MQAKLVVALLVCAFATVLAASSVQASGPALSAGAYRAKANAICADLDKYTPPAGGTLADQFAAVLTKARRSLGSLEQLQPPRSLAPTHAQVTALISKGLGQFSSILAKLRAGTLTTSQFQTAVSRVAGQKQEDALWKKLGANVCAQQ